MTAETARNALLNIGNARTPPAPVATLTTTPAAAPAGGTGAAAGGWDTSGNRDAAITTINTLRTRVTEIETALRDMGILG